MLLNNNSKRISEDLEKIKRANLDPLYLSEQEKITEDEKKQTVEKLKELTFKDYFAMVIAVFSIIIPYLAILIGVIILFIVLFNFLYLR